MQNARNKQLAYEDILSDICAWKSHIAWKYYRTLIIKAGAKYQII